MKAISLWQPWASFIAIGIKPFETRDWPPPATLIGQRIAIHATKKAVNADDREWAAKHGVADVPLGAVVCTAILCAAYQCGQGAEDGRTRIARRVHGSAYEPEKLIADEFGDYSLGRWAWHLVDIERLEPPIAAKGMQGFWDWPGMPV